MKLRLLVLAAGCVALLTGASSLQAQDYYDPPAAAQAMGAPAKYRILSRPMLKIAGWFNGDSANVYEMLYQYESDYIFDSTKFFRAFGPQVTSWQEGIRQIAGTYKRAQAAA